MKNFLNLADSKTIEQLQEKIATQDIILKNMETPDTMPSSNASEQKVVEDIQGMVAKRVPVRQLQHLYLNNQFIFRGVNVRADELVTRGFQILEGDEEGREKCLNLIERSGGANLFWQLSLNADIAGDAYIEHVLNKDHTEIAYLRHINPLNFGFWTDFESGKIIMTENRLPKSYMQIVYNEEGNEVRNEVPKERISHLKFNTFADEFNGISSLQPVYNTAIRLMNMEQAAAESAVRTANPLNVLMTSSKSPNEIMKWSRLFGRISGKEQITLPAGTTLTTVSPGNQNFNEYAEYFLDAVVAALGVPKMILTGISGSGSGNRSTGSIQSRHFYSVIRSNQRYIEHMVNQIFQRYAEMVGFDAPRLAFNDIAEDAASNSQWAIELYNSGVITLEESRNMIGLETNALIESELKIKEVNNTTKKIPGEKTITEDDKKTFHPENKQSIDGSQKGTKRNQKIDPDVESVV